MHIVRREDTLISDEALRNCILPYSSHLGLLVRMIEEVSVHHNACMNGELVKGLDSVWRQRLTGSGAFSDVQITKIESIASSLRHTRDAISSREGSDHGSSSPSDYSDSESYSSNDSENEEEEGEEEEGDEEEEPHPPSLRQRRR